MPGLVHRGNTGSTHGGSTTGFGNDNWDRLADPKGPLGNVLGAWQGRGPYTGLHQSTTFSSAPGLTAH